MGASVTATDEDGDTALHLAVIKVGNYREDNIAKEGSEIHKVTLYTSK